MEAKEMVFLQIFYYCGYRTLVVAIKELAVFNLSVN
jgi:hypothetical protein